MDADDQPLTADDFLRMVETKRAVALATVEDRLACREAWLAAGYAVEFALKALIIRRERLNAWPSKAVRRELYVHSLRDLLAIAGVELASIPKERRGSLRTVLDWNRAHEYTSGRISRANARSMVKAALDEDGVVAWLRRL